MTDPTVLEAAPLPSPEASAVPAGTPAFVDAWPESLPVPLAGWFERNRFAPVWAALLVFVVAFLVFQVLGSLAFAVGPALDVMRGGEPPTDVAALLGQYPRLFLGGNALGQLVAFGLFAVLAARLSTVRWQAFLRLRRPDAGGLGLAALGWAALYPGVLLLGELNARLPVPRFIEQMDQMRADTLEALLLGDAVGPVFLFLTVALTPAICEELLFRGYLQRQVERRVGSVWAFVVVGVCFGAYHLSVAQLLPLSVLGIYLGFVVWATGSVWSGVLVHLLNNGTAVAAAVAARGHPEVDIETMEGLGVPVYLSLALATLGALALTAVVRLLVARRAHATGGQPDTRPVAAVSSPLHPLSPPVL